jgi:hypothetical protein
VRHRGHCLVDHENPAQLCGILGTGSDVQAVEELRRVGSRAAIPVLAAWVTAHTLAALHHAAVWDQVLAQWTG